MESIDVGNGIRFDLYGDRNSSYKVLRNGEVLIEHYFAKAAKNGGHLNPGEVVTRLVGKKDANIAFRWGANNDLMYAIAVRDDAVFTTFGHYWKHSKENIQIKWESDNTVRFYSGSNNKYCVLENTVWKLK